jgi:phosphomannomutase
VLDIGLSGTEEIYFATFHLGVDGGIEVTASHNPMNYNGMKLVRENAKPISGDTGLRDIQRLAEENQFAPVDASVAAPASDIGAAGVRGPPDGLREPGQLHPSAEAGGELRQRRCRSRD